MLFVDVIAFVHNYALQKIVWEKAKLPRKASEPPVYPCQCSTQASMGLPCLHEIWEKQRNPGRLQLADIDPRWWYDRGVVEPQVVRKILLDPLVVKGKGRPKGSKGKSKEKGNGESSTRSDPSLFEHAAIELPSSTAPTAMQTVQPAPSVPISPLDNESVEQIAEAHPELSTTAIAVLRGARSKWDTGHDEGLADLSTTALAIMRGAGQDDDPYEAGTLHERAYLRSLNPIKLASQAEVEALDDEEELDETMLRGDTPPTADVPTTYGGLSSSQLTDTDAPFELEEDAYDWEMYN
jgi:hypothetical protein